MYGTIVSNRKVTDDKLDIEVVVPANTTVLLKLPGVRFDSIKEGGSEWKKVKGIRLDSQRDNTVVFSLQSGTYRFSARMN